MPTTTNMQISFANTTYGQFLDVDAPAKKPIKRFRVPDPKVRKEKPPVFTEPDKQVEQLPSKSGLKLGGLGSMLNKKIGIAHENYTLVQGHPLSHTMLRVNEKDDPDTIISNVFD